MSNLSDRVSYLKGLAEGMEIDQSGKEGKLLTAIIGVLGDVAENIAKMEDDFEELDEYVESIDEDLAELEEIILGDEDDEEDEDDEDFDGLIEYECPSCGNTLYFDAETFDLEEDHQCPNCGKAIFDEVAEDDEDGEDE